MRGWRAVAAVGTVAGLGILSAAVYVADVRRTGTSATALADLAVGLGFALAAALSVSPVAQRVLLALVGVLWLSASLLPVPTWHQAALAVALLGFPNGSLVSRGRWVPGVAFGLVLLTGAGGQLLAAAMFAALAVGLAVAPGRDRRDRCYPVAAATAFAALLAGLWAVRGWAGPSFDFATALVLYELALLSVAAGHVVATRAAARSSASRMDRLLAPPSGSPLPSGTELLERHLAAALGDDGLRLRWLANPPQGERLDDGGSWAGCRVIRDHDEPVAVLSTDAWVLSDAALAGATEDVIRLMARAARLQADERGRLDELANSRRRLVQAEDLVRARLVAALDAEVLSPLGRAAGEIAEAKRGTDQPSPALVAAGEEIAKAQSEMLGLVGGAPPVPLGDGALHEALAVSAVRSALPVDLSFDADAAGDTRAETALFYVCVEALTNAAKHSAATRVGVRLTCAADRLTLVVTDDGCGGADVSGFGLTGLADRAAAYGGELVVHSPIGGGTTVTASVPPRIS